MQILTTTLVDVVTIKAFQTYLLTLLGPVEFPDEKQQEFKE